ncbi:MAG TPA: flagellar motor protein MotB, partial [Bryobacteraceae bacterium]|nr:flagellar motor protein MotB [Bryobacteraceae bacterium]
MENQNPPIIIVRKKVAHAGHHGGAWKVAYADFVTAMMALFIVLWLMNSSEAVKKAIAGYFRDPSGHHAEQGTGQAGVGESISVSKSDMSQLKEKLQAAMKQMPELEKLKDQVAMTVTAEGLRIEMMETEDGLFFESGNARPTSTGREMLEMVASETGKLPYTLMIEGHTDARPFATGGNYSNWELSADRANEARRIMESSGLRPNQVIEIRGYAD